MEQIGQALGSFEESSYLNLNIQRFTELPALSASLTDTPLDVLLFDLEQSQQPKEELQKILHVIPNCAVILLCDDARYALFGYSIRARDYLTTPLYPEDLIDLLTRLMRERLEGHEHYLPLKLNGVWSKLIMRHIVYIESAGHNLIFHMNDGRTFRILSSFSNYQAMIEMNRDFLRCHKSYVVNMRYVIGWDLNYLTLFDGNTVNISRPYRQIVRSFYACYTTQSWDSPPVIPAQPEQEVVT